MFVHWQLHTAQRMMGEDLDGFKINITLGAGDIANEVEQMVIAIFSDMQIDCNCIIIYYGKKSSRIRNVR